MPKYRKVSTRIWCDAKFMSLSDDGKLIFLYLLTCPEMTMAGCMRAYPDGIAQALGWDSERFAKGFGEGFRTGLWNHNSRSGFLVLPNFIKHNLPDNANAAVGVGKLLADMPECQELFQYVRHIETLLQGVSEPLAKGFMKGFGNPLPTQEQEQEQEQEERHEEVRDEPNAHTHNAHTRRSPQDPSEAQEPEQGQEPPSAALPLAREAGKPQSGKKPKDPAGPDDMLFPVAGSDAPAIIRARDIEAWQTNYRFLAIRGHIASLIAYQAENPEKRYPAKSWFYALGKNLAGANQRILADMAARDPSFDPNDPDGSKKAQARWEETQRMIQATKPKNRPDAAQDPPVVAKNSPAQGRKINDVIASLSASKAMGS